MPIQSAGLLMFRRSSGSLEVFLVHPGGPFYAGKDLGVWSIPKGIFNEGDDPLAEAKREFKEETGFVASGPFIPLTPLKQSSGKIVHAWAFEGDCDPESVSSNKFSMEWPPGSRTVKSFPEVDRAAWFRASLAKQKILPGQVGFVHELAEILRKRADS